MEQGNLKDFVDKLQSGAADGDSIEVDIKEVLHENNVHRVYFCADGSVRPREK